MDAERIASLYRERKKNQAPELQAARLVSQAYNNEMPIPLPELDANELPAVANLIQQGLDQTAMRIASTIPDVRYPPVKPNIKKSEDLARLRREANLGWWTANKMNLKLRRRARWILGYASGPMLIRPDAKMRGPKWQLMSPLGAFPAPTGDPDELQPPDCIFAYTRSYSWLEAHYPDAARRLRLHQKEPDTKVDIVQYVDANETVLVAVGNPENPGELDYFSGGEELVRTPNRIGICPVVIPGRITLDRRMGQFDGVVGLYREQAEFAALRKHAVRKAIHPELWLISRPNETAQIIKTADPRTGEMGEIAGADLKVVNVEPSVLALNTEDRLAEAIRQTGGVPAEFSGQAATNVRTGRRAEQLLSAVVDFPMQEVQEVLAEALQVENRIAIAIDKAYWGSEKKSFYMKWGPTSKRSDYTPDEVFEDDVNFVKYPLSGADANGLIVRAGQKMGLGAMSVRAFLRQDPETDDPEAMLDEIRFELLERGVLEDLAQPGSLPLPLKAKVAKRILENRAEVFDAVEDAQRELQEEQAEQSGGDPGMQPGLMDPQAGPQPAGPPPGLADLVGQLNL